MIGNTVGNYKILEKIGEGGMGSVFKGVDLMLEREVAIKALRPELAQQPQVVERFRAEAVTLAKLNHPNIATLHSFFRQGDDYFMVMEFVRGETLDSMLRRHGGMSCDRAIPMFCQALEGMDHAHRLGIIHRDIKPANMMQTELGTIKVMDFGIARVLGSARMTRQGNIIGTIEYMSPEQVKGLESDARSDIYSLGILLYEMLTGRLPFNSTSEYELMRAQIEDSPVPPRDVMPDIPPLVEQALMRTLAKNPESRFQNAAALRVALLGGLGLSPNSLAHPIPGYAAPATRMGDTSRPSMARTGVQPGIAGTVSSHSTASAAAKETTQMPPAPANDPKETRLGAGGAAAVVGAAVHHVPYGAQPSAAQPAASGSVLSRLNWKHYAGAAAAVFVLLIGSVAGLLALTKTPTTKPPQGATQPLNNSPDSTFPPNTQPAGGAVSPADAGIGAPIQAPGAPSVPSGNAQSPDKSRRGAGAGAGATTPDPGTSATPPAEAAVQSPTPAPTPVHPAPAHENRSTGGAGGSTARDNSPAKSNPKSEGKVEKVGGVFKKLGGLLKRDKNKD